MVVIQHTGGVDTFTRTMADRLAEADYVAATPDLYHRLGSDCADKVALMRQLKDAEICADVQAVVEFLQYHHRVDGCDGRRGF